jgi:hypothetical protein
MQERLWLCAAAFGIVSRVASADFIVTVADDLIHPECDLSGNTPCSLRDALIEAQAVENWSIHFAIGTGHQTINLMSNLPDIGKTGSIDARSQPGYAGVPLIEIHRADAGSATHGLHLGSPPLPTDGGVAIKALVINHFNGGCPDCGGIVMDNTPGGNFIQACYIGTDATGMIADGNTVGILDNTSGGNTIGGSTPPFRNVISGNGTGITVSGNPPYSLKDLIVGNYIGTDVLGTGGVPNELGIYVGAPAPAYLPGIRIGGAPGSGDGNVIAGNNSGTGGAITMQYGVGNLVQGNYIGLDETGLASLPLEHGIVLEGEDNDTIVDNVISVGGNGILLSAGYGGPPTTTNTKIHNNYIGTDATGNKVLVAGANGINLSSAHNNTVGGDAVVGEGNVIGGFQYGILVTDASNTIQGNRIGIGLNGAPIPNLLAGIAAWAAGGNTVIGGVGNGLENLIAYNGLGTGTPGHPAAAPGVWVQNGSGNVIRGNSIFGNTGKGIDFSFPASFLPYANDLGDADTGPNNLQNFPLITGVTITPTSIRIQGTLNSKPITTYLIDFYATETPVHPQDLLQGHVSLDFTPVATDAQGNASFDNTAMVTTVPNIWITATATDPEGNTSEFSQRSLFSVTPNRGPASGGTQTTLKGQLFQPLAVERFGGTVTTNTGFVDSQTITAVTPQMPAGTLLDVSVTNPDNSVAIMQKAFMVEFNDVPESSPLYAFIMSLAGDGVTAGCGGGNYCPSNDVTRAQMAVFLLKAKYGPWWLPPPATGTVFLDVPSGSFAAAWIEELHAEGITGGCGGGDYCPGDPVRRDQMAVFLLKTQRGSGYIPPACTGIFGDVPCPSPFANWIEQLFHEGITGGCGGGDYCPASDVTRGQMAVFLVKTFQLP